MSQPINPGITWGRARQSAGWGKWHLLVELRRNVSGQTLVGRWGQVPAGGLFALALCGQVVNDPAWEPQPELVPYTGWGMTSPFPVPKTPWCLPCVESSRRLAGSAPA